MSYNEFNYHNFESLIADLGLVRDDDTPLTEGEIKVLKEDEKRMEQFKDPEPSPNYFALYLEKVKAEELAGNLDSKGRIKKHSPLCDWLLINMEKIMLDVITYDPPKVYRYMLTFTVDPKKVLKQNDLATQDAIESYVAELANKCSDEKAYYVKEHPDKNVHWHVMIHRNSSLKSRNFLSTYQRLYGNVHVSPCKLDDDTASLKYLGKEGSIVWLKGDQSL